MKIVLKAGENNHGQERAEQQKAKTPLKDKYLSWW